MNALLIEIAGGLLVGASLGLVGAGGAILSVPIFDLLLGHPPKDAVAEALLVTCAVALASSVRAAVQKSVDWTLVALLGVPGIIGAAAGGWFAHMLSDTVQMTLFGIVALVAAWKMAAQPSATGPQAGPGTAAPRSVSAPHEAARAAPADAPRARSTAALAKAACVGVGIGVLTGLIGVGGGFLLVPALVLLLRTSMRVAVGTSLAVIVLNSAIGFVGNRIGDPRDVHPDWQAVAVVATCGIAGSLIGSAVADRLPAQLLRRVFAGLLVAVAVMVIARQVFGAR